jgi:hypothetical protein
MARARVAALAAAAVGLACLPAPALAQPGGLMALPSVELATNLVENPGFESANGWRLRPDGTVWNVEAAGRNGRGSLRMSGAGGDGPIPSAEQTFTLEPGYYTIRGWVRAEKLGTTSPRSGVRLCLDGRPRINWWQCTSVARGTTGWTELTRVSIPVRDAGTYRLTVGAYAKPDGTAWFDDVVVARVKTPPLDAYLLYPNYRGLLFDDRAQTVRVALGLGAEAPRADRIRLSLLDEASGAVRTKREWPVSAARAPRFVGEVDASALEAGEYLLRAELVDAGGAEVYRHPDHRIVKTTGKAREKLAVWYDDKNVTHFRGKPAFVLGLYTTSGYSNNRAAYAGGRGGWANDRIAEGPFNMLINYWLGATPIPALSVYMDDLYARGIHYLQTVNFYYEDDPQYPKLPYDAARDGEDALNRWVGKTLAKHPGLAGFYTADERTAEMVPKVFRQHRELRRSAPGTVDYAVLGNGHQEQAPLWRDAADVLGLDPYPITRPGDNNLAMVGEWTRIGQDAVMGSRPLWMVIQFFPLTRQGGWPSRDDLKTMSWMAIVEGAKGLFYWSFGARGLAWVKDPDEKLRHWQDLVAVTKEIKMLEPVLLAPDTAVVRDPTERQIRVLGKKVGDGTRYLFAYNSTNAPVTTRLTLVEPAREITPLDGGQSAAIDHGAIAATFAPYEVKRYRIK